MKTAASRAALAAPLFLAATLTFPQDGGFYLAAGTMATFAGPHDFQVGHKPADDADFTVNSKSTGTFEVGILGFRAAVGYSSQARLPSVRHHRGSARLERYRFRYRRHPEVSHPAS